MNYQNKLVKKPHAQLAKIEVQYGSHLIRLSLKEWIIAGIVVFLVFLFLPVAWRFIEPFQAGPNYRIPYQLSNDYWMYKNYCQLEKSRSKIFVIGDSVIWGEYVTPGETLSCYLNELDTKPLYSNMGVNGIHPVALAGLMKYYAHPIVNSPVILHWNPLWITSPRHDLQIQKEFHFNHPRLVPQFYPEIPCYRASFSEKAGIVAQRLIPFLNWVNHIQVAYFGSLDFPSWTIEHPYTNPISQISFDELVPRYELRHEPDSWKVDGSKQDFPWVSLETSFQWRFFKQTVETLNSRNNNIFVVVGPFNEHMLTDKSLNKYNTLKNQFEEWLKSAPVKYYIPEALPSSLYADASHPLKEGYRLLAERILKNKACQKWMPKVRF